MQIQVHRLPNGLIDFDHYRAAAVAARRKAHREAAQAIKKRIARSFRRRMVPRTGTVMMLAVMFFALVTGARAGSEDEVKAQFAKFVAAQNAHDVKAVRDLLQDSPQFLWITRGTPIWGREAAMKRFEALYQGTWSLDPKLDEMKVIEVQPGVAQLYVPVIFMIAPAGQAAQPTRFLLNQVFVKSGNDWRISSILPIPAPQQ